jgi:DNA-binding XRE family transcriptional regulator
VHALADAGPHAGHGSVAAAAYTGPVQDEPHATGSRRAGAAYAARRQELALTQRELARKGIITASSLIAFEKGRSWPRERTRATLEEIVRWPAGTLADIAAGGDIPGSADAAFAEPSQETVIVGAIEVAMSSVNAAIANLPALDSPKYAERIRAVLADLRRLESVTARAVRTSQGSASVIKSLIAIRRRYDELMTHAATARGATIGQRLYTARRHANLTPAEAAAAIGAPVDLIIAVENETAPPAEARSRLEALIDDLNAS